MKEQTPQLGSQRTWLDIDRVIESKRKLSKSWSREGGDKPDCRPHWAGEVGELRPSSTGWKWASRHQGPTWALHEEASFLKGQLCCWWLATHCCLFICIKDLAFLLLFETANLASLPLCDFIQTFTLEPVLWGPPHWPRLQGPMHHTFHPAQPSPSRVLYSGPFSHHMVTTAGKRAQKDLPLLPGVHWEQCASVNQGWEYFSKSIFVWMVIRLWFH